ncbi:MAG: hypothetical protein J6B56_05485 [Clostridia bacterium]|nr:hypothetical protein [Clostridia bacterium]
MKSIGNLLILGDSYSTFEGYNPEGNGVWYKSGGHENTDVAEVEDTWWRKLLKEVDGTLVLNESYSGATVCNTERPQIPHTSFVYRLDKLIERDFFKQNTIDTVIFFGGTNDNWTDAPIGTTQFSDFTEGDLKQVLPAFGYAIKTLRQAAPNAKIFLVVNTNLKAELVEGIKCIGEHFGASVIALSNVHKQAGHPNKEGMTDIKNQILEAL